MPKSRKPRKKSSQNTNLAIVKRRPRVNLLHVLYLVVAVFMILSLAAGLFGGIAAPQVGDQAGTSAAQQAGRDTGPRTPIPPTSEPVPTP